MMRNWFLIPLVVVSTFSGAEVFRDPSTPLFKASEPIKKAGKVYSKKRYILSSVFIGGNKKIAMINDKEYREGDSIGRYRVKEISVNTVLITSSSVSQVLELYPVDKTGFIIK